MSQRSWIRYPVRPHTLLSPSADSRGAVASYWQNYVHQVLVNPLGGLSLPRKSVARLTDSADITLDVYRGRKTTTQQQLTNLPITYGLMPGRVAQSVGHLTHKLGVLGSIPGLATYFRFSFRFFKKGSCQLLAKVCARSTG